MYTGAVIITMNFNFVKKNINEVLIIALSGNNNSLINNLSRTSGHATFSHLQIITLTKTKETPKIVYRLWLNNRCFSHVLLCTCSFLHMCIFSDMYFLTKCIFHIAELRHFIKHICLTISIIYIFFDKMYIIQLIITFP